MSQRLSLRRLRILAALTVLATASGATAEDAPGADLVSGERIWQRCAVCPSESRIAFGGFGCLCQDGSNLALDTRQRSGDGFECDGDGGGDGAAAARRARTIGAAVGSSVGVLVLLCFSCVVCVVMCGVSVSTARCRRRSRSSSR